MPTSPISESCESIPLRFGAEASRTIGKIPQSHQYDDHMEEKMTHQKMTHQGICRACNTMAGKGVDLEKQESDPEKVHRKKKLSWKRILLYSVLCINTMILNGICGYLLYWHVTEERLPGENDIDNPEVGVTAALVQNSATNVSQLPVLSVHLDKNQISDEVFQWACPAENTDGQQFSCRGGAITVPMDGWYSMYLRISIYKVPGSAENKIYDCITKKPSEHDNSGLEHIRCNRMSAPSGYVGQSEVTVLRHFLKKGEVIQISTITDPSILHGQHKESVFEIVFEHGHL